MNASDDRPDRLRPALARGLILVGIALLPRVASAQMTMPCDPFGNLPDGATRDDVTLGDAFNRSVTVSVSDHTSPPGELTVTFYGTKTTVYTQECLSFGGAGFAWYTKVQAEKGNYPSKAGDSNAGRVLTSHTQGFGLNKAQTKWVQFSDDDTLNSLVGNVLIGITKPPAGMSGAKAELRANEKIYDGENPDPISSYRMTKKYEMLESASAPGRYVLTYIYAYKNITSSQRTVSHTREIFKTGDPNYDQVDLSVSKLDSQETYPLTVNGNTITMKNNYASLYMGGTMGNTIYTQHTYSNASDPTVPVGTEKSEGIPFQSAWTSRLQTRECFDTVPYDTLSSTLCPYDQDNGGLPVSMTP
jgi:hypothetical protein